MRKPQTAVVFYIADAYCIHFVLELKESKMICQELFGFLVSSSFCFFFFLFVQF